MNGNTNAYHIHSDMNDSNLTIITISFISNLM